MTARRQRTRVANAAFLAIVIAIVGNHGNAQRREVSRALSALAVAGGYRIVEPRLSFADTHAPFRPVPAEERLRQHYPPRLIMPGDRALAALALGRWTEALEHFEREPAAADPLDVSAAFYMRGVAANSFADLGRALQSLRDAPDSPAAVFNRALILEQLADRDAAAVEWQRYLAKDARSEWAAEARRHLQRTRRPSTAMTWQAEKPMLLDAAAAGRADIVRQLAHRYPLGARRVVEVELLPAWGAAVSRGDVDAAARALHAAALIVAQRKLHDEHLLETAIAEITAIEDPRDAAALAAAYRTYGEGAAALEAAKHEAALASFARALDLAGGRSVAFDAIVTPALATARYRRYDLAGAETLIESTRKRHEHRLDRFLTVRARLDWLSGLIRVARGDVSGALRAYERALAVYERLGEAEHRAAQHVNQADSYAYLGDDERTGMHLRKALEHAAEAEDPRRLQGILKVATDFLLDTAGPEPAAAMQDRLVRMARTTGDPARIADALVARSPVLTRAGRRAEALSDLAAAARLFPQIVDEPLKLRLRADASTAEAFAYRDSDDSRVVTSLSSAIELTGRLQLHALLAQLLLERGRAYTRLGNFQAAERDFRTAIDDLEQQRTVVDDAGLRITWLDRADRVFVDLAEILLGRGRVEEAFDLLERSRARELLDRTSGRAMQPMPVSAIRARLPEDTALVTHTLAATKLITFVVTRSGVRAFEQTADTRRITALTRDIRDGFDSAQGLPQQALHELGRLLIDGASLPPGRRIIFIPDRAFHTLPFAALRTASGQYLVEERVIEMAPSATLIVLRARAVQPAGRAASVLAVASAERPAAFDDLAPLTHAPDEAKRIAARYPNSRVLLGSDPDAPALLSVSRAYDVLHFAGHAIVDVRSPRRSALLVGATGRITAEQIEAEDLSHLHLVVLGGCNTGVGKSYRSEGVMSLARAFLAASVPGVVGTVAPIEDDGAKRLLDEFHRVHAQSGDAAAALREAQLRMLRSGRVYDAEPARWSSFQVIRGAAERERRAHHAHQSEGHRSRTIRARRIEG